MAPSDLTVADPWVRIVTTVVARSLLVLQRGSPPDIHDETEVDLVAPDAALCRASEGIPRTGGRPSAVDLSIDPAFYEPGAILDSLRLVDPATLARAILHAVSAEVGAAAAPIAFSPRLGLRLEACLRDRIAEFLDRKPRPMLIRPCEGVPVSRMSVTVMLARDLAVGTVRCIRGTGGEFHRRSDAGCPLFSLGTLLRWILFLLLVYCIVQLFQRRAEVARACRRIVWSCGPLAFPPPSYRSADGFWSSLSAQGYHVHRVVR